MAFSPRLLWLIKESANFCAVVFWLEFLQQRNIILSQIQIQYLYYFILNILRTNELKLTELTRAEQYHHGGICGA